MAGISRRCFIGLGASAALGAMLPGVAKAFGGLREPPVVRSRNGILRVTLTAEPRRCVVAGEEREVMLYNGCLPGPTLVADPGDRIEVRLVNRLDEPTNVHTHGLHVSAAGNADNPFVHVAPGESFDYAFDIPRDHPPGLNWYHPHAHGHGVQQMFGGLAGALVIRGRYDGLGRMRDRVFVLQAPEWEPDGSLKPFSPALLGSQLRLLNGQACPTIDIAEGETQRWRIVNASINSAFDLRLEGRTLLQIAADGNPFDRAVAKDTLLLVPGQRAEVVVTGGPAGTRQLRTLPYNHGFGAVSPDCEVATVQSTTALPSSRPRIDRLLRPFEDLRGLPVDRRRTLAFTMSGGFGFDGRPFDHHRVDQTVALGALEEWTIENPTGLMHPFHIHVNPFQVTHVNGAPVEPAGYHDTYPVDPGGSITFRTRFADFTGRSLYHCHLVLHSDIGMMGVFEVTP
jgi:FtsP/CotA-like multicopper oxidase with cupredoxin domain